MKLNPSLVVLTVILSLSLVQVVGATDLIIQDVSSSKLFSGGCCYTIVGEVYNAGPTASFGTTVTAIVYNVGGSVIYVSSTMTDEPGIPIGQSSQFTILITNVAIVSEIASYDLMVGSR